MSVDTRVTVSKRIWVALAILALLLLYTSYGMVRARSDLVSAISERDKAQSTAKESTLELKHIKGELAQALADKQQVIKELAAQGNRLAEFSRGEEKAKSQLANVSSSTQAAEKRIAELESRLAKAQNLIRAARRNADEMASLREEVKSLTSELTSTRAMLEVTRSELEQLRATAQPYGGRDGDQTRKPY